MTTIRDDIADKLETDWADIPGLAEVWVNPSQTQVNVNTRVTAIVSQQAIRAFPQAPQSHRTFSLTLEIVSPIRDIDAGAAQLEEIVPVILDYLDSRYQHGDAEALLYTEEQFAYRIPLSVIVSKD